MLKSVSKTDAPSLLLLPSLLSGLAFVYLPTGPVTEYNEAFLISPLYKGHTGMLLPVSHGLLKNGSLAA